MPVSRKKGSEEVRPAGGGAAVATRRVLGLKESSQLPSKRTLNLCMKEKGGLSIEMFLFILSLILIAIILVEFLGVYRPYSRVETLERDVAAAQSQLDATNAKMSDYDKVQKDYNVYNFDGFDLSSTDRLTVLRLLDDHIIKNDAFENAQISNIIIDDNSGTPTQTVVTFTIYVESTNDSWVTDLIRDLQGDERVALVKPGTVNNTASGTSVGFTVTLKDATTVPKTEGNKA